MWATLSELAFRGSHVGRGQGGNYVVEKPDKHHCIQVTKVSISSGKACWWHSLLIWCAMLFFPKPHNSNLTMKKKLLDKPKSSIILPNTWLVLLKTIEVINTNKSLRYCCNTEEVKESWWLHVMYYFKQERKTENGHWGKINDNKNQSIEPGSKNTPELVVSYDRHSIVI